MHPGSAAHGKVGDANTNGNKATSLFILCSEDCKADLTGAIGHFVIPYSQTSSLCIISSRSRPAWPSKEQDQAKTKSKTWTELPSRCSHPITPHLLPANLHTRPPPASVFLDGILTASDTATSASSDGAATAGAGQPGWLSAGETCLRSRSRWWLWLPVSRTIP